MTLTISPKAKSAQIISNYTRNNMNSKVENFLNSERGYNFIKSALKSKILSKKEVEKRLKKLHNKYSFL